MNTNRGVGVLSLLFICLQTFGAAPTVNTAMSSPQYAAPGYAVALSLAVNDIDSTSLQFTWDFGDGSAVEVFTYPYSPAGSTIYHVYFSAGIYDIVCTVTDGTSTLTQVYQVIVVDFTDQDFKARFAAPQVVQRAAIQFNNIYCIDPENKITELRYYLGDVRPRNTFKNRVLETFLSKEGLSTISLVALSDAKYSVVKSDVFFSPDLLPLDVSVSGTFSMLMPNRDQLTITARLLKNNATFQDNAPIALEFAGLRFETTPKKNKAQGWVFKKTKDIVVETVDVTVKISKTSFIQAILIENAQAGNTTFFFDMGIDPTDGKRRVSGVSCNLGIVFKDEKSNSGRIVTFD